MRKDWVVKTARVAGVVGLMLASAIGVGMVSEAYVSEQVPVSLYGKFIYLDQWQRGWVSMNGTWQIEGNKHAFPLNKSEITCRKETMRCSEAIGRIGGERQKQLFVDEETHEITKWDEDTLVYASSAQCVEYVYSVNRQTQQVAGVRRVKPDMGAACDSKEKLLNLVLVNGIEVSRRLQSEARPVAVNVIALVAILFFGGRKVLSIVKRPDAPTAAS